MLLSVLSTLAGSVFGAAQNIIEHKQDSSRELKIAQIQADKEIEIAKYGITLSQTQLQTQQSITEQEQFKTESSMKSSDVEEYKAFAEAVAQTSSLWQDSSIFGHIANFIVVTTRPIVTYILLFFVVALGLQVISFEKVDENTLIIFDLVLSEFSAISSYWFVRRSFEKKKTPEFSSTSKKKVK